MAMLGALPRVPVATSAKVGYRTLNRIRIRQRGHISSVIKEKVYMSPNDQEQPVIEAKQEVVSEFVERIIVECKELSEKVLKLFNFVHSKNIDKLNNLEIFLLSEQLHRMQQYQVVLSARISLYVDKA